MKFDLIYLFFSYRGRITRMHYWLGGASLLAIVLLGVVLILMLGVALADPSNNIVTVMVGLAVLLYAFELYAGVAISVKRAHDRDRSGWFVFAALIPIVGPIWILLELGLTDGTPGPNRFGPSPKGLGGDVAPPVSVLAQ